MDESSTSSIFIRVILFPLISLVLDINCGSYICTDIQGLKNFRQVKKEETDHRMSNGGKIVALALDIYVLTLSSRLAFIWTIVILLGPMWAIEHRNDR